MYFGRKKIIIFFTLISISITKYTIATKDDLCNLPKACRYKTVHFFETFWNNEYISNAETNGIECDMNDPLYRFNFDEWSLDYQPNKGKCKFLKENTNKYTIIVDLKWKFHNPIIMDQSLNLGDFIKYLSYTGKYYTFRITNSQGFDVDLYDVEVEKKIQLEWQNLLKMELINSQLNFYANKKLIKSCEDLISSNLTLPRSIFQIRSPNLSENGFASLLLQNIKYQDNLCPLVFKNAFIRLIVFRGMIKSFYKTNVLSFSREIFGQDINSKIKGINIYSSYNIDLDLNFLNPSVFQTLNTIYLNGIKSIDGNIFVHLKKMYYLEIKADFTKQLMHKGIDWIKEWNKDIRVDFNDSKSICNYFKNRVYLKIIFNELPISNFFPDEDFCIYKDYPFEQLVILINRKIDIDNITCTYRWLTKHFNKLVNFFPNDSRYEDLETQSVMQRLLSISMTICNFEQLISLCDKNNYQVKEIWDKSDIYNLNMIFIITVIILNYIISFFGIITNVIVVWIISSKKTAEIFKDFKQYSYLRLNSIFYVIILVIQLLSWICECSNTYDVFCPEIRKFVAIQFLKIILKECFITSLRFMCNFAYFAFSLNRISLIGKDHGKIVTFISTVGSLKYTIATTLISVALSVVKGFRYQVNYDHSELSYPIPSEVDISFSPTWDKDLYFITNSICDIFNYIVFVVIHIVIDIYMVVKLRKTLNEKAAKFSSQSAKSKMKENDDIVHKAIQMVVINAVLSIFFKIPLSFMSIINVFAEFNSKFSWFSSAFPQFGIFDGYLVKTGLSIFIIYLSDFLFTLLISIQLFVYLRFDKNISNGFDIIFNIKKKNNNVPNKNIVIADKTRKNANKDINNKK